MNNGNQQDLEHNNSSNNDIASKRLQELSRNGLNMATHGAWNKVRNAPVIGAAARRGEEKMANKLADNKLGRKLANPTNHQRPNLGVSNKENQTKPNNPKSNDVGSRNLQNSLANKAYNLWNNRKKKKKDNNSSSSDNNSNNNQNDDSAGSTMDDFLGQAKVRIKIKIIIYSAIIMIVLLLIFAFFMAIFGVDIVTTIPSVGPSTYGTDSFQSTYDKGSREYQDEINYYKKLQEVSKNYASSHGEELKINYIHATLIYIYYRVDVDERSDKGENIPIDYRKMTSMIDKIASLMVPENKNKNIDYEKNGEFYNNLKKSNDLKNYYAELLKEENLDSILDGIFDLAKGLEDITYHDDTVITEETKVTVTENKKQQTGKTEVKTKTLTINDYLASSIYASSDSQLSDEIIKAYTIAYSTNVVSQNKKLSIDSNTAITSNSLCDVKLGCSYDASGSLVSGPGNRNSQNTIYYNGGYYYKRPLTNTEITNLNKTINTVFGNVIVNQDGTYPTIDINKLGGTGSSYKDILANSYGSITLKNIGEDSYILDGSYGTQKVLTSVIFYDQGDYGNYSFCGLSRETIKTSGCGVTSMAMVASTYENDKSYSPLMMNNEAKNKGLCAKGQGTYQAFFGKEAKALNYKYLNASKYRKQDLNLILKHLSLGHLVVVRMGPGHFTGGGHYMVLGGVDPETKKVYVYDPNNRSNSSWRKTGNGWYSFNDIIVKEAYNFYIIWKG